MPLDDGNGGFIPPKNGTTESPPSYSGVWNLVAVYQAVGQGLWPVPPLTGDIGLFGSGFNGSSNLNNIVYIKITDLGNAIDFGDLAIARNSAGGCASTTRGVFGGGSTGGAVNVIDYVTFSTIGNATDFGDLSVTRMGASGCGSSTRGLFIGGYTGSASNIIDYITIATTGNATDFGDTTVARGWGGALSSTTRGVLGGGGTYFSGYSNVIDYVTIASVGNAASFGDLSYQPEGVAGCSNATRGLFGGGYNNSSGNTYYNIIEYITIASTGNTTDFGDLTQNMGYTSACSNTTRGVFGGSSTGNGNTISYVTIASAGNATDFGDLPETSPGASTWYYLAACSNAHGGLA